jgi:hypothetical protein
VEIIYTDKDGNQTKFTEEMATVAIAERDTLRHEIEVIREWNKRHTDRIATIRGLVHDFFNERYEVGDDTIECELDDVNTLLQDIGANKLKRTYTVKGSIDFVITGVEAEDEDDAQSSVENDLDLELKGDGTVDDWSFNSVEASEE